MVRKYYKIYLVLFIFKLFCCFEYLNCQGITGGKILLFNPSAISIGYGETDVMVEGIDSIYNDPSGLMGIERKTLMFPSLSFGDMVCFAAAVGMRVSKKITFGLGGINLTTGSEEIVDIEGKKTDRYFEYNSNLIILSGNLMLLHNLGLGISTKYLQDKIYDNSADTFCYDVGIRYQKERMAFSGSIQNIGNGLRKNESLPIIYRLGNVWYFENRDKAIGCEIEYRDEKWEIKTGSAVKITEDKDDKITLILISGLRYELGNPKSYPYWEMHFSDSVGLCFYVSSLQFNVAVRNIIFQKYINKERLVLSLNINF
jgi:hypothetical protein